jgi:lysophospholipase
MRSVRIRQGGQKSFLAWLSIVSIAAGMAVMLPTPLFAGHQPTRVVPDRVIPSTKYALSLLKETRFQPPRGWRWGSFKNADGAVLRFGWCGATTSFRRAIVILQGYQSTIEDFFETAQDFQALGFDVWVFDWRGQGGSDRWLPDRQKAYSRGFERDERDLVLFVKDVVRRRGPVFFVGDSFGGHIGLRALHDFPGIAQAAAFSSPAIAFRTGTISPRLVRFAAGLALMLGYETEYAPGEYDWSFDPDAGEPTDDAADDRERALAAEAWRLSNPRLREGGATWGYLNAFFHSSDIETAQGWMSAIRTPVLVGEVPNDAIAVAPLMATSCRAMTKCTLMELPGAKHAIFSDADSFRTPFIAAILKFFVSQGSQRSVQSRQRVTTK